MSLFEDDRSLLVITTVTPWSELPRFRHQVTRQLARWYNVLYIQRLFSVEGGGECNSEILFRKVSRNIIVYTPISIPKWLSRFYWNIPPLHFILDHFISNKIVNVVKKESNQAILINFQFDFYSLLKKSIFTKKIYLCNDEFPNSARRSWQRKILNSYETNVINNSDCCIVHSRPLLKKFKSKHTNVKLLLPGHEFEINKNNVKGVSHNNEYISVCYMGFINHRLRIDWLFEICNQENMKLYLLGPVAKTIDLSRLLKHQNFSLLPPQTGDALQSVLSTMDICIIPFDTNLPVVKSCTPNKIFQYVACGKPVVASNMSTPISFPDNFYYTANSADSFIDSIRHAYNNDTKDLVLSRLSFAEKNSWNKRGEQLLEYIYALE